MAQGQTVREVREDAEEMRDDAVWDGSREELCGYISDALIGLAALSRSADLPDLAGYLEIGGHAARRERENLGAQGELKRALTE